MRNYRFAFALFIVIVGLALLIYSGVSSTAKAVVTVDELKKNPSNRSGLRLGARVTEDEIEYQTNPDFRLRFFVRDIPEGSEKVQVVYHGIMPDTLQAGRDVILEGDFQGNQFVAKNLLTQCPSKYKPPVPQ